MAVSAVVTIVGLGEVVGASDPEPQALRPMRVDFDVHERRESAHMREVPATPAPSVQPEVPEAEETESHAYTGQEGVICAYFSDNCEHALRVFACESGPDFIDGNPYDQYVGAAQIDIYLHGWRFQGEPYELDSNMRVARQLYNERGWAPWPVCGYR